MRIDALDVCAYRIPLERPESDGTITWDSTTVVVVEPRAGGMTGLGFTYGPAACAALIREILAAQVLGRDALDVGAAWQTMVASIRNAGRPGVASMAIAAVDTALWDLKARLLGQPLARLLGTTSAEVPVYASGGFTSLTDSELEAQLGGWVHEAGFSRVKMKIASRRGAEPERDLERVERARKTIGEEVELYVDANGGYTAKQAIRLSARLSSLGVAWFEEPVPSDDLEGLARIRDAIEIEVAAGEYGYDLAYFARMAPVVDVLQVDVSRCAGVSEWLRAAALAAAHGLDVSGHTAQSLHAHVACAIPNLRHVEYWHDYVRADRVLFDGVLDPIAGELRPDLSRPGMGLVLKRSDAECYRVA